SRSRRTRPPCPMAAWSSGATPTCSCTGSSSTIARSTPATSGPARRARRSRLAALPSRTTVRSIRRWSAASTARPRSRRRGRRARSCTARLDRPVTEVVSPYADRKTQRVSSASVHAVFGEVVAERALADAHGVGGVLLDAAGALDRAPNRLALDPFDVLAQVQRGQRRGGRRGGAHQVHHV